MTKLSVNVNKVATLRNTRTLGIPSVVHASKLCLDAGADGITVHPRPDQRHIKPHDVDEINELLAFYPSAEFNIEGNPLIEYMHIVEKARPDQCTFVPDGREQFTSNHGWNLREPGIDQRLAPLMVRLKQSGCRISLFMDPVAEDMPLAKSLGADRVELYTEPFASAFANGDRDAARPYTEAAERAHALGLEVNAGHDLNLENLPAFLAQVPHVAEVSIGHALIADALEFGLPETVKRYVKACRG
jgi:pyridoxine 5-phosphate synthase